MSDAELKTILYEALNHPRGVVVQTNSPEKLKQRLYVVRAEERKRGNFSFDELTFRTSPLASDSELWLVLKVSPTEETQSGE